MAIEDLNNKTDGIFDTLLPQIELDYIVRSPVGTFSRAAMGAVNMLESHSVKACIGPYAYAALKGIPTFSLVIFLQ